MAQKELGTHLEASASMLHTIGGDRGRTHLVDALPLLFMSFEKLRELIVVACDREIMDLCAHPWPGALIQSSNTI